MVFTYMEEIRIRDGRTTVIIGGSGGEYHIPICEGNHCIGSVEEARRFYRNITGKDERQ